MEETDKDLQLHLDQEPEKLTVETPVWIKACIMNCTNKMMKLELEIDQQFEHNIAIHGLSRYSLKKVGPGDKTYFKVLIFPQFTGIHTLNGLIVKDKYTETVYRFNDKDSDLAFEIEPAKDEVEDLFS